MPWRTLLVGTMHGMAGSAALVVLAASSIDDPWSGLAYVLLFGLGSVVGMAALSADHRRAADLDGGLADRRQPRAAGCDRHRHHRRRRCT